MREPSLTDEGTGAIRRGTTPDARRRALRRLIDERRIVRVLEVHNGLTGLIAESIEADTSAGPRAFDAMWASSLTDSTARGKPDIEVVDVSARMVMLNEVLEVTTKPIIYDGDTGGKPEHFPFTVRTLERLGISAVIIEDKIGLKKNSLFGTDVEQTQDTIEGFQEKIRAGKAAQATEEFMIVARIESMILGKGVDDALYRAEAFIEAGADAVMVHSRNADPTEVFEFCRGYATLPVHRPLVAVPTSYSRVTEDELAEHGANVVIYANHLLRSAYPAMVQTARMILEHGRSAEADDRLMPIREILELIPGGK
jgi:phosphoenolpyruvate phosphomutase / 2-hydroxyethylphosphonate cytidylyltransferase